MTPKTLALPVGKLPSDILAAMLKKYAFPDERVIVGPSIGEDAAAIDFGDRYLLVTTDPITFVAEDIGTYAVKINANDIATMGGRPLWLLASILLPPSQATNELVEEIFRQLSVACNEIDVALCGGHTEIAPGVETAIITGAMIGEVEKKRLITTAGAKAGDDIILTKAIAVEGTSIIARQKAKELEPIFGSRFVQKCKDFLRNPGISILNEAKIAARIADIHSMHDPTEGGLATGLFEVAYAADVGVMVEEERIPVFPECETLCRHYGLDPLGLIASGALLIALNPCDTGKVLDALHKNGIPGFVIGKIMPKDYGLKIIKRNQTLELPLFPRDEITKIL